MTLKQTPIYTDHRSNNITTWYHTIKTKTQTKLKFFHCSFKALHNTLNMLYSKYPTLKDYLPFHSLPKWYNIVLCLPFRSSNAPPETVFLVFEFKAPKGYWQLKMDLGNQLLQRNVLTYLDYVEYYGEDGNACNSGFYSFPWGEESLGCLTADIVEK